MMSRVIRPVNQGLFISMLRNSGRAMSTYASPYTINIPKEPITKFILDRAAGFGNQPAIIDGPTGRTITYAELPQRIANAVKGLKAKGVQKGDVVCIHMPNCPEYIIAFQAVAAMGAVNTTSNPLYTPTELLHQLHDSGAKYVITIPQLLDTVKTAAAGVPSETTGVKDFFVLGTPSASFLVDPTPGAKLEIEDVDPEEQMLVLPYSSGTTGLPKGVMLSHYNVVANVEQCVGNDAVSIDMRKGDVVMGVLPCYHIYGMTVVMATALRKGCTLVMLPKFDPQLFLQVIAKYKVNFAPLVPPIINFLARHPAVAGVDTSSMRVIFSGAAPLDAETQKLAEARLKGCVVRQGYGMTEMSPVSHIADPHQPLFGSIGVPVPNTVCKIVDVETGKELGPGPSNVGELCVKGPQVMKGYLNNSAATARTLIGGFCHTGDIAWRDEKGNTFIVDRLKELIKTKGFQVAPAELEGLLLQHPAVMDCAVLGKADPKVGEVPVAFVVTKKAALSVTNPDAAAKLPNVTAEALQGFVSGKVAEYKQLAEVRFVEAIPRNPSGKILRRVLREKL